MGKLEISFGKIDTAILVMREVAAWAWEQGYRVWLDEWLTKEELVIPDAQPENFGIGTIDIEIDCAFILQWVDSNFWPNVPKYEAAYLHKLCVRRRFAGMGMTKLVTKIYLNAGYKIVDIVDYTNGYSVTLYELEV